MGVDYSESKDDYSHHSNSSLDIDPQSFVNVGSFLSAQELRPTLESVYTQTSTSTSSTTTDASSGGDRSRKSMLISFILLVALLLGTNVYSWTENRAWKSERAVLEARVVELESYMSKRTTREAPDYTPPQACSNDVLDNCWFKVGLGNCAKDVLVNPISTAEGAWRSGWDSTMEVIAAAGHAVSRDFQELGEELHNVGHAILDFLGCDSTKSGS